MLTAWHDMGLRTMRESVTSSSGPKNASWLARERLRAGGSGLVSFISLFVSTVTNFFLFYSGIISRFLLFDFLFILFRHSFNSFWFIQLYFVLYSLYNSNFNLNLFASILVIRFAEFFFFDQ